MPLPEKLRPQPPEDPATYLVPTVAPADADLDPLLGDPAGHYAANFVAKGDWRGLTTFLAAVPDADDRCFYVTALMETVDGMPSWVDEWIATEPRSALALVIRGVRRTQVAWEARGAGPWFDADAQRLFREQLTAADADLVAAASLDPADVLPLVQMLVTARGLRLGSDVLLQRFRDAVALSPLNYRAHAHVLQSLAKKWSGSHDQMYQFARAVARKAPPGSRLHTLIAEAHVEGWLDGAPDHRHLYWQVPGIREELHQAAALSIDHPTFVNGADGAAHRNTFAFCFWSLDEPGPLGVQLEQIGDDVTRLPWAYMGIGATAAHARARDYVAYARANAGGGGGGPITQTLTA